MINVLPAVIGRKDAKLLITKLKHYSMELKHYETPEVEIFETSLDGNLLQASTRGFTEDEDFDTRFFGLE